MTVARDSAGIEFLWGSYSLTDLVIQGGWDFSAHAPGGTSTIAAPFSILNWGNPGMQLTVNNLVFTGGAASPSRTNSGAPRMPT